MCASVSRMPECTTQRGRCRSPSLCSRAASSRGIAQFTNRRVVNRLSGSSTSASKRQSRSSTNGLIVPPARSRVSVMYAPVSFSPGTRPGCAGGPSSSNSATTRALIRRSGPHRCCPCGSSRDGSPVCRLQLLPLRNACHMLHSADVSRRSAGASPSLAPVTVAPPRSHGALRQAVCAGSRRWSSSPLRGRRAGPGARRCSAVRAGAGGPGRCPGGATCSDACRRALFRPPPRAPPMTPAPTPCPPGDPLNTRGQGQLRSTSATGPAADRLARHYVSLSDTGARPGDGSETLGG